MVTTTTGLPPHERYEPIDILRGIALFGVLIVNLVNAFRVSIFQQFLTPSEHLTWLNSFLEKFISNAIEMKAFAIFSFLFGVGLAVQFDRLAQRGKPFYFLTRRLIVLLAFGLIHLLFIWNGDILTEYAIAGMIVLPFLKCRNRFIGFCAALFLLLYLFLPFFPLPIGLPEVEEMKKHVAAANSIYANGNYFSITRFSQSELPLLLPLHVWIIPRTLGLFLFGVLVWRMKLLQNLDTHRRSLWLSAIGATVVGSGFALMDANDFFYQFGLVGLVLSNIGSMILTFGYVATVLVLTTCFSARKILNLFAPIGQMAFTNYIMQSIVFSFVFFGYGLGYFAKIDICSAVAMGIFVYAAQMTFSAWWLDRYLYGPLEWVWRSFMYGKCQLMVKVRQA